MSNVIIGIDPGVSGAIAVINGDDIEVEDMPVLSTGKRTEYNIPVLVALLEHKTKGANSHVIYELVHAMPKQGVTSSFNFGEGLGIIRGVIGALKLPVTPVTPQKWKKSLLHGRQKDKDASRQRAMELFPQLTDQLSLKKHDGRAEALLIAEWGRRHLIGQD